MEVFGTVIDVPLRWGDMDAQGHVNNALVVDYLQEARAGFLRGGANAHLLGGGVIVTAQQVEYLRPIEFAADPVQVGIGVKHVGASRFEVAYLVEQDGQPCARAVTTLCPFDFEAQRPRRLTEQERAWFTSQLVEADEPRALSAPHLLGRGNAVDQFVRWSDLDAYGHVNNVKFFDYVQEARVAVTTALDPSTRRGGEMLWLVVRQDVDYLGQMDARQEPYSTRVAPSALGGSSVTFVTEIVDPLALDAKQRPRVMARARTVLVCADGQGKPQQLPEHTRATFSAALVE